MNLKLFDSDVLFQRSKNIICILNSLFKAVQIHMKVLTSPLFFKRTSSGDNGFRTMEIVNHSQIVNHPLQSIKSLYVYVLIPVS